MWSVHAHRLRVPANQRRASLAPLTTPRDMRSIPKPVIFVVLALVVIVVPFAAFGELGTDTLARWRESHPEPAYLAAAVVGLLASDILLPIPSSPLSTFAGAELGAVWGTLASWLGMNLGAIGGFWLARLAGWPLAKRFSSPRDLARTRRMTRRYGAAVLVIFRAVPILAEATVLLTGAMRLSWRRFLPPVIAANLGVAVVYSVLGQLAKDYDLLPVAIVLSIAIPLGIATIIRVRMR